MTRTSKLVLIFVALFMLGVFLPISRYRFIDGDEGFYLLASRLVFEHRVLYRDFLFVQAPLLPYLYGLWMKCAGLSWISARTFAGLLAALLGTFLFVDTCINTRKWTAGLCAGVLFASCTLVFAWLPVVKTYSVCALFLFLSYMILSLVASTSPQLACALSGVCLGIAVDARSYIVGLIPVFLWWIYREVEVAKRQWAPLYFTGGFSIAVIPNLYFLVLCPKAYLFGNLGLHALGTDAGLIGNYPQKLVTLARVVAVGDPDSNGTQVGMLIIICLLSTIRKTKPPTRLAFQLATTLSLISLVPTPSWVQYFCLVVPLLITATVCSASDLLDLLNVKKKVAIFVVLASLAIFVSLSVPDARRFLVTGDKITASPQDAFNWRISTVRAISKAIDQVASPGESVMAFWPGYIFESKTLPFPGFENIFGLNLSQTLNPVQLSKYRVMSHGQVYADINARAPRVVVLGNQDYIREYKASYRKALESNGYTPVRNIGGASIYVRNDR